MDLLNNSLPSPCYIKLENESQSESMIVAPESEQAPEVSLCEYVCGV